LDQDVEAIQRLLDEKKAENIKIVDIRALDTIADISLFVLRTHSPIANHWQTHWKNYWIKRTSPTALKVTLQVIGCLWT